MNYRKWVLTVTLSFQLFLICSDASTNRALLQSEAAGLPDRRGEAIPTIGEVGSLVEKSFNGLFVLASNRSASFVLGDFNGDGDKDLAAAVRLSREVDRDDTSISDFMMYTPLPREFDVNIYGTERNPLGTLGHWPRAEFLVVLNGKPGGWHPQLPRDRTVLLMQTKGSSMKLFSFRGQLRSATAYPGQKEPGPPPSLMCDSILLGRALPHDKGQVIYWDGGRYRYYPIEFNVKR